MGNLKVRKVIYSGQKYYFESATFDNNIILIEGDNGTGKSTLCNLIYFGLGGRVEEFRLDSDTKHKEITSDTDNYVELYISINSDLFLLRRFISENEILVTPVKERLITNKDQPITLFDTLEMAGDSKVYSLYRSEQVPFTFSDWMLGKLDITAVELVQGYKSFKINFNDLMRLIYHDQQPDPKEIYKKLDIKNNFINDSQIIRKAIFELLVGKSYSKFYEAIVRAQKAEREKAVAKSLVDEYTNLADQIRGKEELRNRVHLQEEIEKKEQQLERLNAARTAFKQNRDASITIHPDIDTFKNKIKENELRLSDIQEQLVTLYDERYKLLSIHKTTLREAEQIQKVIHTHDQLSLFASDTCPYCLTHVDRARGHCVCGSSIEEEQYERFFYSSQEYNEILKSKTKSLATIQLAHESCNEDITRLMNEKIALTEELNDQKTKFKTLLDSLDKTIDLDSINDIDDKILEIREALSNLHRTLELEIKLESLQKDYEDKRDHSNKCNLERDNLEVKAKQDIADKVKKFSSIYNQLMIDTLPNCRSAHIKPEDYMPLINDGEYREASSGVSIRLMYYLSLLKLSLLEDDVTFPRFLLVDTPETAGIELDRLLKCLDKFSELEDYKKDYQVIISTGLNKYPPSLADKRILYMPTKAEALLKARTQLN